MISNILIQINIDSYSDVFEKTIKPKFENIHLKSLTQIQNENFFRMKNTIKDPALCDIDKTFNNFIIHLNKKVDLFLINCDFKLIFIRFNPHIKTDIYHNTSFNNLKR